MSQTRSQWLPLDKDDQTRRKSTIVHSLLGDQVYDYLWRQIASNQLGPGAKLSDLRISEQLGVSRTPVREALRRLAQDGIVRAETQRGFFVATFSSNDVREIYDLRTVLEVLAVRLALPNLSAADLAAAQEQLNEVAQQLAEDAPAASERFLAVDRSFHALLVQSARNRRLMAMMASLQCQVAVFQVYGIHSKAILALSVDHHRAILAALRALDGKAAEAAMEHHIQEVKQHVLAKLVESEEHP